MWQAIGFVVVEILKFVLGKFLEPAKASDARGDLRIPVDGDAVLRDIESSLRRASTINPPVPRHSSIG